MSDRTAYQLYVYECPENERAGVLEVINQNELSADWGGPVGVGDELVLGQGYVDDEKSCGQTAEIADAIIAAAPDATFVIWEDPKYEWLGSLAMYSPRLGRFDAECDADGNALFNSTQILGWLREGKGIEEIDPLVGGPWSDCIREHRAAIDGAEVS